AIYVGAGLMLGFILVYRTRLAMAVGASLNQFILGAIGLAGVILLVASAVGFWMLHNQPSSAAAVSGKPPEAARTASAPQYLSNIEIYFEGNSIEGPLVVVGNIVSTQDRLRIFVDCADVAFLPNGRIGSPRQRISIDELKDKVKDQAVKFVLLRKD